MLQILQSDSEVYIDSGFIYLPLMYDTSVEEELHGSIQHGASARSASGGSPDLVKIRGKYYLKSLSVVSLLDNYGKFDPETYEYLRRSVFNKFLRALNPNSPAVDEKLGTIVFQVMPYFIKKKDRLHKKHVSGEEILDLVSRGLSIPSRFYDDANKFSETLALKKRLQNLAGPAIPSLSGHFSAATLRQWVLKALESTIVEEEKTRLGGLLHNREKFARIQKKYIAILLFVKERGALEINGCGFFRNGTSSEYFVYVRTGRFALKDFYGRLYLFPDCRVAVSTSGPMIPYVLDSYKHPFLKGVDAMQKICVRGDFVPASRFSAIGAIQALEEGLSALFHGYNSRRGNGYHRLDGMKMEENSIVFEEFRIQSDDPRIVSGEIEVKNDFY